MTVRIPRFALLIALRTARRSGEDPIALGPQPGEPNYVGSCTESAELQGVRSGLSVGEALARCPHLELVPADPGATSVASEQVTVALENIGAGVHVRDVGTWQFTSSGLERLHGGIDGIVRRTRAALPVGLDARIGVAPTVFSSFHAARLAAPRTPCVIDHDSCADVLAAVEARHLPLTESELNALSHMGISTIGQFADLPRTSVVERFGLDGLRAWHCARGTDGSHVPPRIPPQPVEAVLHFPDSVGALPALQAAARLLIGQIAHTAHRRSSAIRSITVHAWLSDGGSWTRTITLREAGNQRDRLYTATLPALEAISGPVETLVIRADASAPTFGTQLALDEIDTKERTRRINETVRHISGTHGNMAIMRPEAMEPWSRLPEREWALVPYDASISPEQSR